MPDVEGAAGVAGVAGVAGMADDFIAEVLAFLAAAFFADFFVDFFMPSCFIESSDFIAGAGVAGVVGAAVWAIAAVVVMTNAPAISVASSLFM